ncbi:MAG: DNA topoisomerase IV subunit A, partial [Proteobacteria bacterium]|nr:DNA topoisomerase IV subunit A [Pseudomonadota bacterium]
EWLGFRADTIEKKLRFRLEKILNRLHILEGFQIAFLNIDQVIHIIRTSDHPKQALIKSFDLSEIQATSILEIRLRQLAKLEEIKILSEIKELEAQRKILEKRLNSKKAFKAYMIDEIREDAKKYGDKRRSPIKERQEAEAFSATDILDIEPVTIILSQNGWIRSAKGHDIDPEKVKFKTGDDLMSFLRIRSDKPVVFLDNTGRSYMLFSHVLPSARSNGEPLTGHLSLGPDTAIQYMLSQEEEDLFLVGSDNGCGFIIRFSDFLTTYKNGKAVISVKDGFSLLPPEPVLNLETDNIVAVTSLGRLLIFPVSQLPKLKKGQGNKIITIPKKQLNSNDPEKLKLLKILPLNSNLVIHSGKHFLRLSPGNQVDYTGMRGYRGKKLPRGYQVVDRIEVIPIKSADETNL